LACRLVGGPTSPQQVRSFPVYRGKLRNKWILGTSQLSLQRSKMY